MANQKIGIVAFSTIWLDPSSEVSKVYMVNVLTVDVKQKAFSDSEKIVVDFQERGEILEEKIADEIVDELEERIVVVVERIEVEVVFVVPNDVPVPGSTFSFKKSKSKKGGF